MRTEEFNHIILPMRSDLKAYALRLTESDDNAEDLVQGVEPQKGVVSQCQHSFYYLQPMARRASPTERADEGATHHGHS